MKFSIQVLAKCFESAWVLSLANEASAGRGFTSINSLMEQRLGNQIGFTRTPRRRTQVEAGSSLSDMFHKSFYSAPSQALTDFATAETAQNSETQTTPARITQTTKAAV